jgi:Transposase IS200 like
MPEHVHLLVSEPERSTLAVALQALKQSVARRLIAGRPHFWQTRYYDFNVSTAKKRIEKDCMCTTQWIAALHAPQSCEAWTGGEAGRLGLEQLSTLCDGSGGCGRD